MQNVTKRVEVVGKATGLEKLKTELNGVAVAQDKVSASGRKMTVAEQRIEASNLRLVAANQKLSAAQKTVNDLMAAGPQPLQRMAQANARLASAEAQVVSASASVSSARKRAAIETASATAATNANTAAAKANAMAQNAMASSSGAAAFRQRQLAVQSLDVAQSLALGMPPMMVAIQQGGQLAGIYAGQGGLKGAAKEAAASVLSFARANPIALATTAALGVGLLGLTHEINQTTDVAVGMGDVFKATMIVARDAIGSILAPAVAAIAPYFSAAWDGAVGFTKTAINTIIGAGVGAYKFIVTEWGSLPQALGGAAIRGAQAFLDGFASMLRDAAKMYNDFVLSIGAMNLTIDASIFAPELSNPFGDAGVSGAQAFNEAFNFDYVGAGFDAIRNKAVELATATDSEEGVSGAAKKAGGALRKAADDAKDPWKGLRGAVDTASEGLKFARDTVGGFVSDLKSGLKSGEGFWDSFKNAAANALDKIADKLLNSVLDAIFQVNNAGSGLNFGGGGGGLFGGLLSGIGSLFGGFRASGGGMMSGKYYRVNESGQEFAMNARATAQFRPQLEAMNRGQAPNMGGGGAQGLHVTWGLSSDSEGNLMPFIESVTDQKVGAAISQNNSALQKQMPKMVYAAQQSNQQRGRR